MQSRELERLEPRHLLAAVPVGSPDIDFGDGGDARLFYLDLYAIGVAVQGDGKVLTAGYGRPTAQSTEPMKMFVASLLANGAPDPTFGGEANGQPAGTPAGMVALDYGPAGRPTVKIVPLDDGGMLIGGSDVGAGNGYKLARLETDGSLDTAFGGPSNGHAGDDPGFATISVVPDTLPPGVVLDTPHVLRDIAVADDGSIAIVGDAPGGFDGGGDQRGGRGIVLLNPDGSLDTGFDGDGVFWDFYVAQPHLGVNSTTRFFDAVVFDENGDLVIANRRRSFLSESGVTSDSSMLTLVDRDGAVSLAAGGSTFAGAAEDLVRLGDGTYLAGIQRIDTQGNDTISGALRFDAARNAIVPPGPDGLIRLSVPLAAGERIERPRIATLPDERFYLSGVVTSGIDGGPQRTFAGRFLADGAPDPGFGVQAVARTVQLDPGPVDGQVFHSIAVAPDDDLVIGLVDQQAVMVGESAFITRIQSNVRRIEGGNAIWLNRGGSLVLVGTSGDDDIRVTRRLRDGRIVARIGDIAWSFAPSRVKRVQIFAQGGDDRVFIGDGVQKAYIDGGAGDDTLTGGQRNDILVGGFGNDVLRGGLGTDASDDDPQDDRDEIEVLLS